MELGEGFKLCSGSCISAGRGKGESELLLAFDAGSVQIYDVRDIRQLIVWCVTVHGTTVYYSSLYHCTGCVSQLCL